jgi:very-short-patch-repair endonuclease
MKARPEVLSHEIAAGQHGVVTRPQLLAAGVTRRMIDARLKSGLLRRLHRGVYLLGSLRGALEPARAREMAAVLACGRGAVASHRSAAWLWDMAPRPAPAAPVEIRIPGASRVRRPGILVRSSSELDADDTTLLGGIPVTTPLRTLRDLSMVVGPRELERAAARAERQNLVRSDDLSSLVARHRGRPGAPVLRAVLGRGGVPVLTRSEAETRFLALVRGGRLPGPEANVMVRGYEVDFLWRAQGIAVEVDGFGFHSSRHRFERDRLRDAEMLAAGIRVMRVTWRQIVDEPSATLVRLAQALAAGTALVGLAQAVAAR